MVADIRTAIVTGGSRGLGLALVRALAERRWTVVTDARDGDALRDAVADVGPNVVAVPGDLTDPDHRAELVAAAGDPIDLLVNNAGGLGPSPLPGLADYPLDELADLFTVNVVAPLGLIQAALPSLAPGRRDRRHHVGRVGRGVRGVGRVRGDEGGARPPRPGPRRRSAPTCGCSPSTRATCARRCTRTPSRARTSPTARRPKPACPASSPSSTATSRVVATERRRSCRDGDRRTVGRLRAPARAGGDRASGADPRPPRRRAHAGLDRRPRAQAHDCPRPRHLAAAWRRRRHQHVGDDAGGGRRDDARTATAVVVHISTELPTGLHLVEVRRPADDGTTEPDFDDLTGATLALPGAGGVHLLGRMPRSVRLWVATLDLPVPLVEYLCRHGRPIRYRYVPDSWPINAYTNVYATEPGSAEMPSAGRALTTDVITDLVAHGIVVAPIVLHTGVASLEAHEAPYPERYRVPPTTARLVNDVRRSGRSNLVVAVGTTVVRALETVTDDDGVVHPGEGWTELVVTPERGVARRRRVAHRLARTAGQPSATARSRRRPLGAGACLRHRARGRVSVARVRRRPPDPSRASGREPR